jgi:hypothetical protein
MNAHNKGASRTENAHRCQAICEHLKKVDLFTAAFHSDDNFGGRSIEE